MNIYQHAFLLSTLAVCAAYVWRSDDEGSILASFLFAIAAFLTVAYAVGGTLTFFLWLGTL